MGCACPSRMQEGLRTFTSTSSALPLKLKHRVQSRPDSLRKSGSVLTEKTSEGHSTKVPQDIIKLHYQFLAKSLEKSDSGKFAQVRKPRRSRRESRRRSISAFFPHYRHTYPSDRSLKRSRSVAMNAEHSRVNRCEYDPDLPPSEVPSGSRTSEETPTNPQKGILKQRKLKPLHSL